MTEVELKLDAELTRVMAYVKDELKDALIRNALQEILDDDLEHCWHPDDVRYYKKLKLSAQRLLRHYT